MIKIKLEYYNRRFGKEPSTNTDLFRRGFNISLSMMEEDYVRVSETEFGTLLHLQKITLFGDEYNIKDKSFTVEEGGGCWKFYVEHEDDFLNDMEDLPF